MQLLVLVVVVVPLISSTVEGGAGIRSSDLREVAENSRKLAAELSLILARVRAGLAGAVKEEMVSQSPSQEEERDEAKNRRSHKYREMLRQFYLGDHYDFSI